MARPGHGEPAQSGIVGGGRRLSGGSSRRVHLGGDLFEHCPAERDWTPVRCADTGRRRAGDGDPFERCRAERDWTPVCCADAGRRRAGRPRAGAATEPLCNSGIAACYTGRSTAEAATAIHAEIPDLVTLNEICQGDLPTLQRALAEVIPDGGVVSAFQGAGDRRTGDVYRCRNGQPYGIGLISRWPSVPGSAAGGGIYPSQDTDDPEERGWLCLGVAASPAMTVCTTHLAYTKLEVAAAQCTYLFGAVIAEMRELDPVVPVVLGGDLNLGSGDSAYVTSCLPAASALVDDGGRAARSGDTRIRRQRLPTDRPARYHRPSGPARHALSPSAPLNTVAEPHVSALAVPSAI